MLRKTSLSAVAASVVLGAMVLPGLNADAVNVSHAELKNGVLLLDGVNAAPGIYVTVASSSSQAGARSGSSGEYHVEAANFRADDCQVVVSDRRTPIVTVTLTGCTPTPVTPPKTNPPPSGSCVITPGATATFGVGATDTETFTINVQ